MDEFVAPSQRHDFEIAIFCALALEYDAVTLLFDEYWEKDYGRATGDTNTYTAGRIGQHNVVLVVLAGMGKASAATAFSSINPSYTGVQLALLVGVCAGIPKDNDGNDIFLGDVIVSHFVVQYDFARRLPDGDDVLGRPSSNIRAFVNTLQTRLHQQRLGARTLDNLRVLQDKDGSGYYDYPGRALDKLFEPDFRHKHPPSQNCIVCDRCVATSHPACRQAEKLSCDELQCDEARLVPRTPRQTKTSEDEVDNGAELHDGHLWIHFGPMASGDLVMRSGEDRDRIARAHKTIAFDMEGAGLFDNLPTIVIKGVCDYADSHKNKRFQNYAAATAASAMKALLQQYQRTDRRHVPSIINVPELTRYISGLPGGLLE
ncbi:Uncharacterized protein TPAR_04341 [Tolypocladium paradoxum]|uniref:Nucleoside phosphorylase domain-containing protein n=1 Tax=Tolypocladium paradoxum TaxID=94208 RepID=A0A2S4KZ39_9HYPO|nr:Uncharacterized protein TPAR_04341 [Tolypocladium paradoxum]